MSKYILFLLSCVIAIIFDLSARQTLLFGNIYLLPCLVIASGLVVFESRRYISFFFWVSFLSVTYGLLSIINFGALILALTLTFGIWQFLSRVITFPISAVFAQILVFFNVWGLILIITKSGFTLGQYVIYLTTNIIISLIMYLVANRVGVSRTEPKLKYR